MQETIDGVNKVIQMWGACDLNDMPRILDIRRMASIYRYHLAEVKAEQESAFITHETHRKTTYYAEIDKHMKDGESRSAAEVKAEVEVRELREKEAMAERTFKHYRDLLDSIDQVLNAMSSAINNGMQEKKLTRND